MFKRIRLAEGIAPSVQLKEQKAKSAGDIRYLPHQGAKEIARRKRQAERVAAKAAQVAS